MIFKTILLIYLLCGFAVCWIINNTIEKIGGWQGVYEAAKVLDTDVADKIRQYDFNDPKIKFLFDTVIVLLWPVFVTNLFNRY